MIGKIGAAEGVRPPRFACEVVIEEDQNLLDGAPFTEDGNQESALWADAKGVKGSESFMWCTLRE